MKDSQYNFSKGYLEILCVNVLHVLCVLYRPEADDVKALQQELSSLHIVMEKSTSEYTRQIDDLTKAKSLRDDEKTRSNFLSLMCSYCMACLDSMSNWRA